MSLYGAEFLRNVKKNLSIFENDPPEINFHHHGFLTLADEKNAEQLVASHKMQVECGAFVDLLSAKQIKRKFPWLNTDGIVVGAHGVQNEGWFDPLALLVALRTKAEYFKTYYVEGDALAFNIMEHTRTGMIDETGREKETANWLIFRLPNGDIRQIHFQHCIIAAGAFSGQISKRLRLGETAGYRSTFCPIEPR